MTFLFFIIGFIVLIKSASILVEASSFLAKRMGVSDLVIGLTIVSFGTSVPELLVNVFASINGQTEIAIGNILGSNIANVLLILGISIAIRSLKVQKSTILSEIPFSLIAALLVGFLANAGLYDSSNQLILSRVDGCILLFFFLLYMLYIVALAKTEGPDTSTEETVPVSKIPPGVLILVSLVGLYFGGDWVVKGAVEIANYFGLSQSFIGLTIVAVGTSLPELVTSAVAAAKNKSDLAVGNVIGSNIFNILWILGLSSLIKPLPFQVTSNFDILAIIGSSTLVIIGLLIGKRYVLQRWVGYVFVLVYVGYIYLLVARG